MNYVPHIQFGFNWPAVSEKIFENNGGVKTFLLSIWPFAASFFPVK